MEIADTFVSALVAGVAVFVVHFLGQSRSKAFEASSRADIAALRSDNASIRSEMATKSDIQAIRSELATIRSDLTKVALAVAPEPRRNTS